MMKLAALGAKVLRLLPPEPAHNLTVKALKLGLGPRRTTPASKLLATRIAGLEFPNPVGLAAGFDKNAEVPDAALALGFGFVEIGAVTPRAQPGNARPRVFRLPADGAVINRYGFNNDGLGVIASRLAERAHKPGILGVNLGANKDSVDRIEDYVTSLVALDGLAQFFTVNISSPNTPGLRALQDKAALDELLARVVEARATMKSRPPIFLKLAPDLTDEDRADIVASLQASSLDGIIVSNTTLARPNSLAAPHALEQGGLSGRPLFQPSTKILAEFARALDRSLPIIGVGGVSSARDAYTKILKGASLVQLYTALVYEGPGLAARIVDELPELLSADGFTCVAEAVGADL